MQTTTPSVPLKERTLKLVKTAPRSVSFADMARNIGVTAKWVSLFASGKIKNPGVDTVQKLHDYLNGLSD